MSIVPIPEPIPLAVSAGRRLPITVSIDDRWAAWVASERRRDEDALHEIHTALLMMVVALALGGAIYLSFGVPL